jgi:type II secretory pathway pseudopilin PulG
VDAVAIAIIGAIASIAAGITAGLFARRKVRAEAGNLITEAASTLLEQYREDNRQARDAGIALEFKLLTLQTDMAQMRTDLASTRGELVSTRGELEATRIELRETRTELADTRRGVRLLVEQVELLGQTPAWRPPQAGTQ